MKNRLAVVLLFLATITNVNGQESSEGKAVFKIDYESTFASALPKKETVLFSPQITKCIAELPKGVTVEGVNYIFFKDSSQFYNLYTMGREIEGHGKFAILENPVALKFSKPKGVNKKILGYSCKEMTAETIDGKKKYKFIYTESMSASYLPVSFNAALPNVFVLQYEEQSSQWIKRGKAVSIDFIKLIDTDKVIPSDYYPISREKFRQLSGASVITN
jgi:hypothetical protein